MGSIDGLPPQLAAELARQYDILGLLGRGGMGTVYLARERSLDRQVAIKVLQGEAVDSAELRERFRREARVAARLVHPHIVPLHAFGETEDALFFVMGYVDGETLAVRLDRDGRLAGDVALRILAEIADALAFAHREGVVHRDVKPENILLEAKSGRALLADFGIARVEGRATSVTMTGIAVGTPNYMSPEQAAGVREIDGRSDIYALGIIGYRMLAGRLPFRGESAQAVLAQHAIGKPDDLALVVAPADRGIARVIMRALEKDPAARWARAEDLRDSVQGAAADAPALPEELERIDGLGTALLATLLGCVEASYLLALAVHAGGMLAAEWDLATAAALALIPPFSARRAVRALGWRETLRVMFHPPSFWSSWWPRPLRRADDLWNRLPQPVRRFRAWRDSTILLWVGFTAAVPVIVVEAHF
jgi:serine/threonine protein kinase